MKLQIRLFLVFIMVGFSSIVLTGLLTSIITPYLILGEEEEERLNPGTGINPLDFETEEVEHSITPPNEFVNRAILAAGLSVAILASIASWLISRRITSPILQITEATEAIATGNYNRQVEQIQNDEIGVLVTHFNKMAQALAKIEQTRQQLIADVSHELRTPLTAIRGMIEGVEDKVIDHTPENYQLLYQQIDRLQRLVSDMEAMSYANSSALILNMEPFPLEEFVTDIVAIMRPQFEEKEVMLTCHFIDPVTEFVADRERLEQVFINLLSNSLAYTPQKGHVKIRVLREGKIVRFEVEDNGIGLAPENLDFIFQRFYRVDKSRTRSTGGSGLGLTIAKHMVDAHNGKIWAESAGLTHGTVIRVDIPFNLT